MRCSATLALLLLVLVLVGCGGGDAGPEDVGLDTNGPCVPVGARETVCDDLRDDDCDGFVDCRDVDCAGSADCAAACVPSPEITLGACGDGNDNDCDGLTDCADPSCIQPGNFACVGKAWTSRCVSPLTGSQSMTTTGMELLLTSSGVSGHATHGPSGMSVDIVTVGASASATPVNLVAPPNDDRDSCTHCFVLHRGGKSFYVRNANVVVAALPTELGQPFSATLSGSFEEVTINGAQVTPVDDGECLVLVWTLSGTAVSSTTSLGIAGTGAAVTAALQGRMAQGAGPTLCDGTETLANTPDDCACQEAPLHICPGGHACPSGSTCLPHGRCECHDDMLPIQCATGGLCNTGGTTCGAGSPWSCIPMGCGVQNYTVSCGSGSSCPTHSTCNSNGTFCNCDPGYEWNPCTSPGGAGYGWCVPTWVPACGGVPVILSCHPEDMELGSYCGDHSVCGPGLGCTCDPGYVAASCDGIRCSEENPCGQRVLPSGCLPDAQVP